MMSANTPTPKKKAVPSPPTKDETKEEAAKPAELPPAMANLKDLTAPQLKQAMVAIRAEIKRRDEAAKSSRPKKGDRVKIEAAGRFKGKVGVVILSRKTRAFVEVEGIEQPAYVLHTDLTPVATQ